MLLFLSPSSLCVCLIIEYDEKLIFVVCFRYELSEECADDDDDKIAISELRKNILEELKMHDSFAEVLDS